MQLLFGILTVSACVAAAGEPAEPAEPLAADDECAAGGEGACGLSALQRRGGRREAVPEAPRVWNNTYLQQFHADLEYDADVELKMQNCQGMFDQIIRDGWEINFYSMNYDAEAASSMAYSGSAQALATFMDPKTDNIQITWPGQNKCSKERSQVVWFYPRVDHNGAFNLNDYVCQRLSIFVNDRSTTCLNLYRVASVSDIDHILDKWTPSKSVVHAVLGGHGSDDTHGVLLFGHTYSNERQGEVQENAETNAMLMRLKDDLTLYGTVFMDSCYAARNGLAKFVSERIPFSWVFGGVLSLDNAIQMRETSFPGGSHDGPPRVLTDPKAGFGERIKVFHFGQDLGFVTQYLTS